MKRNSKTLNRTDKFTGILIDRDVWDDPEHPEYACSFCSRLLVRLSDKNNQSESWFCRNCSIEFPDKTQTRKKSKLGMQREEVEPAVTSIQTDQSKSVETRHEPELRGAFAAMAKKGTIRFTSYQDSSQ
jgi:ribosomal protein L37AE/L43A